MLAEDEGELLTVTLGPVALELQRNALVRGKTAQVFS
jgi:hypothetical protein